jgi:hypothetical protein
LVERHKGDAGEIAVVTARWWDAHPAGDGPVTSAGEARFEVKAVDLLPDL